LIRSDGANRRNAGCHGAGHRDGAIARGLTQFRTGALIQGDPPLTGITDLKLRLAVTTALVFARYAGTTVPRPGIAQIGVKAVLRFEVRCGRIADVEN